MKTGFKREFQIFKEDVTEGFIWICSKENEPFNKEAKINKYLQLGYTILIP